MKFMITKKKNLRSSNGLLGDLQGSERNEFYEKEKVNTRSKETRAVMNKNLTDKFRTIRTSSEDSKDSTITPELCKSEEVMVCRTDVVRGSCLGYGQTRLAVQRGTKFASQQQGSQQKQKDDCVLGGSLEQKDNTRVQVWNVGTHCRGAHELRVDRFPFKWEKHVVQTSGHGTLELDATTGDTRVMRHKVVRFFEKSSSLEISFLTADRHRIRHRDQRHYLAWWLTPRLEIESTTFIIWLRHWLLQQK